MATLSSWTRDGRPYTLCTPAATLKSTLERHGYTVYHYPDDHHLAAVPPEDHTPFSATGWPGPSPYGWGMADDIMPHRDPRMPTMAQLGAKILADKRAGVAGLAWLKYMNWTDAAGACWNESWTPTYRRNPSSDRGHIHTSCRSDYYLSTIAAGYDPVAALMAPSQEEHMAKLIIVSDGPHPGGVYVTDYATRRWLTPEALGKMGAAGGPAWGQGIQTYTSAAADLAFGPDVETLRGARGDTGPKGDRGPQGEPGQPGRDGIGAGATITISGSVTQVGP